MNEAEFDEQHRVELERWRLIHALKGHGFLEAKHCEEQCDDPQCISGCLNQHAYLFRAAIVQGITLARATNDPRYPPAIIQTSRICTDHAPQYCHDTLCQVSGCLNRPAYLYRDIIKLASDEQLWKALKK